MFHGFGVQGVILIYHSLRFGNYGSVFPNWNSYRDWGICLFLNYDFLRSIRNQVTPIKMRNQVLPFVTFLVVLFVTFSGVKKWPPFGESRGHSDWASRIQVLGQLAQQSAFLQVPKQVIIQCIDDDFGSLKCLVQNGHMYISSSHGHGLLVYKPAISDVMKNLSLHI